MSARSRARSSLKANRVEGGEHEHRGPDPAVAELGADGEAVALAGEHDVEHDHVEGGGARGADRLVAVLDEVDGEALAEQAAPERGGEPPVVLDDEHTHRGSLGAFDELSLNGVVHWRL